MKALEEIYDEGVRGLACALEAEIIVDKTFLAACGTDPLTARALAREGTFATRDVTIMARRILTVIEQVRAGL